MMQHDSITVAIPAKNEAERIIACLFALARQTRRPQSVVVLANNCRDRTASIARTVAPALPYKLHVECHAFPPEQANAGPARRRTMALAAQLVHENGILLTTDADGMAAPDWIQRNCQAIAAGADLVCGRVVLDPIEAALIPTRPRDNEALESTLIGLLDCIAGQLDPDPADPPPRHPETAGASLAVTLEAFRRVGGLPAVPFGEDRAFVCALARMDARIRHDPSVVVTVSGRTVGRARGGMADTIRRRIQRPDEFTDERVEPAVDAYRRYDFRHRLRLAWRQQLLPADLAVDLGIAPNNLAPLLKEQFFGTAWAGIEAISPFLRRRRVRFSELSRQIDHARYLIEHDGTSDMVCGSSPSR
jgi:hypothetical protein